MAEVIMAMYLSMPSCPLRSEKSWPCIAALAAAAAAAQIDQIWSTCQSSAAQLLVLAGCTNPAARKQRC